MTKEEKDEDSINLRAVRYGYRHPTGFSYIDIKTYYSKRPEDWEVVKAFLQDARKNKEIRTNLTTPFVLLKTTGSADEDATYTLSYEAYFNYLGYLEFVMARRNARTAFWTAIIAIAISIIAMCASIYYSQRQILTPVKMDAGQYQQLIETIAHER